MRLFSPTVLNISFPDYHVYRVIVISTSDNANIHEEFPFIQVILIAVTGMLIGLSIRKEIIKKQGRT